MAISINKPTEPTLELTNEDRKFIELVQNRITVYGQIPYTVPQKLIIDLIKESAMYFFRMGYWRSQHTVFYQLKREDVVDFLVDDYCHKHSHHHNHHNPNIDHCWPKGANGQCLGKESHKVIKLCPFFPEHKFHTDELDHHCLHDECDFEHQCLHCNPQLDLLGHSDNIDKYSLRAKYRNFRGYGIRLPGFVNVVREVYLCNQQDFDTINEIFNSSTDMLFRQQMSPYGYSLMGINSNLYIQEVTVKMTEQAAWHAVYSTSIPIRWNSATKMLILNHEIDENTKSLMLQCDCNVDIQELYSDDVFIKYVVGRTKQELRRLIGSHTIPLPGDVQVNVDELCYHCEEDVNEVNDVLKGGTGIGDVILQR